MNDRNVCGLMKHQGQPKRLVGGELVCDTCNAVVVDRTYVRIHVERLVSTWRISLMAEGHGDYEVRVYRTAGEALARVTELGRRGHALWTNPTNMRANLALRAEAGKE